MDEATAAYDGPPMRVLHLGKYLPPHPGGIERFLAELMPAQRRLGMRPAALVHAEPDAGAPACRRQAGAATLRVPVLGRLAFAPISPSWPCRLQHMIRRWRPDLLHLHLPNPSAFAILALPAARRLPWLLHWHADVPADALDWRLRVLYRGYRPLETATLRRAAAIVATSSAYAESSTALRRWRDKIRIVPLGLADQPRTPATPKLWPQPDLLRVLFVGRFSYYKGLHHLVDAIARTAGASLVLVGGGDCEAELRRRVERQDLGDRVRFAGSLDDAALDGAYAAADVLCLPSIERSEAFGMVLLEAMRAGVACIATTVPGSGMADVLEQGRAGLLVEPGDPAALAAALAQLRDQPDLRRQLAEQGRERFRLRFQIDQTARSLRAVYDSLRSTSIASPYEKKR